VRRDGVRNAKKIILSASHHELILLFAEYRVHNITEKHLDFFYTSAFECPRR
jgi:hypothetical protein